MPLVRMNTSGSNYFDQRVSTDPKQKKQSEAKGSLALQRCAQNEIQLADQESCAIDALKTCVVTCDADSVDPHTESECATQLVYKSTTKP